MKTLKRMMGLLVLVVLLVLLAGTEGKSRVIVAGCPPGYIYSGYLGGCIVPDMGDGKHFSNFCPGGAYEYEEMTDEHIDVFPVCSDCGMVFGYKPIYIRC